MTKTATKIRTHSEADYEAIAQINNALFPEFPETAEEIAHSDKQRIKDMEDPVQPIKWKRFVWEEDGKVVAFGSYGQAPFMFHPHKFEVWVAVHPDFQERGIGGKLFTHIVDKVMAFDPIKLSSWTCPEKVPATVPFLEKRGFVGGMKVWDSKLTLSDWDPTPFLDAVMRVEEQGIRMMNMLELRELWPDWDRRIYEMEQGIWKDIPLPDPHTDPGFEWFKRHVLESPNLYPEAAWFAVDGEASVGLSVLWKQKAGNHLATGLTGVSRSHRRRGIAMGLKVKALSYAKSQGHSWVMTDNEENNVGMIGINKALGFQDYPSWMGFDKILKEEA
ncbi:GNAT family N-acetyltransferase [bacterium]|nr:GNAT family N-acetyltransferase [bacterium]